MFAMRASGLRWASSLARAPGAPKTRKNTCFSKTPASKTRKNTCFQTHLPAGARKSGKNGKHVKTRVFALRRVSAPLDRWQKSTQKHVLSAAGLGKDTQKHASFGGSTRKTRKNTCNQTHLPETRKNTCFPLFAPPGGQNGLRPASRASRGRSRVETTRFCVFLRPPCWKSTCFYVCFGLPGPSTGTTPGAQGRKKGPGPATLRWKARVFACL